MIFLYGLFILLGIGLLYLFVTKVVPELTKKEIKEEEEEGGDDSLLTKFERASKLLAEATALIEDISANSNAEIEELTSEIEKLKQVSKGAEEKIKKLKELQEDESQ